MARHITAEMLKSFADEIRGYLPDLARIGKLGKKSSQDDLRIAYRRCHTIKGAAGLIGLGPLSHTANLLEEYFDELSQASPRKINVKLVKAGCEFFTCYVEAIPNRPDNLAELVQPIVVLYRRWRGLSVDGDAAALQEIITADPVPEGDTEVDEESAEFTPPPVDDPATIDPDFVAVFSGEAEDALVIAYDTLYTLESSPGDQAAQQELRRRIHNLKGASATIGLLCSSALMHRLEDVLDALVEPVGEISSSVMQVTYLALDTFSDLSRLQYEIPAIQPQVDRAFQQLQSLLDASVPSTPAEPVSALSAAVVADLPVAEELPAIESVEPIVEQPAIDVVALAIETPESTATPELAPVTVSAESSLDEPAPVIVPVEATPVEDIPEPVAMAETTAAQAEPTAEVPDDLPGATQPGVIHLTDAIEASFIDLQPYAAAVSEPRSSRGSSGSVAASGEVIRVPIERLNELIQLVSELMVNRTAFEQRMQRFQATIEEMRWVTGRLQELASRNSIDLEARMLGDSQRLSSGWIPPQLSGRFHHPEFDSLEFDRYNEFHLFSRSLLETASDLQSVSKEISQTHHDFESLLNRQQVLSSDLQDRLMNTRMIPISSVSAKLSRAVRNVVEATGKPASLDLQGGHVLLDKTVLDELTDPLIHLLRNAVDHGIESAEARKAAGKPSQAKISVRAQYQGTHVLIDVQDDGQGLDTQAIRQAAIDHGMITAEIAEQLDVAQIQSLIFLPSLSTAAAVSQVSGRGIGLDVVQTAVEKLKGTIEIDSQPGQGTRFVIRLPMSLAVTRAVFVTARGESFAIPLRDIQRIVRIERSRLHKIGQAPVIQIGDETIPLRDLGELLDLPPQSEAETEAVPVLFLSTGTQRYALAVDRINTAREIVVKSLGTHIRRAPAVMGATLTGDGRVVPILHAAELLQPRRSASLLNRPVDHRAAPRADLTRRAYSVLVVDDSVSVRKVASSMLEHQGWKAIPARDGIEALEILQRSDETPDVVLLDVEMPRMDGYELLSTLRALPRFADLPIVMVTSRSGEKHRAKARELGATDYLVKPFDGDLLIALIHRLVAARQAATVGVLN